MSAHRSRFTYYPYGAHRLALPDKAESLVDQTLSIFEITKRLLHEADRLFEGSTVIFEIPSSDLEPTHFFRIYLCSHDALYPHLPQLWLCSSGRVRTRFMRTILSLRAGTPYIKSKVLVADPCTRSLSTPS